MNPGRHTSITKLTQKEVTATADRHEMLYSGQLGGARASFTFCDLSGLDLAGRNLSFNVTSKKYPEQHITLKNTRQVNPNPADLKRIDEELAVQIRA